MFVGEGEFGSVYKGSYLTDQGVVREVAVKALSRDAVEPSQVADSMQCSLAIQFTLNQNQGHIFWF